MRSRSCTGADPGFSGGGGAPRLCAHAHHERSLGGISSSVLSVFFTDKFALSQSDARISVAYNSCQWLTSFMKCCPEVLYGRGPGPAWRALERLGVFDALSCYLSLIFYKAFWYKIRLEKNIFDQTLRGRARLLRPLQIRHCL